MKVALSYISPNGTSVVDSSVISFSSFRGATFQKLGVFLHLAAEGRSRQKTIPPFGPRRRLGWQILYRLAIGFFQLRISVEECRGFAHKTCPNFRRRIQSLRTCCSMAPASRAREILSPLPVYNEEV